MLSIRLDSDVPLTDQIVAGIRRAIVASQLGKGSPLPTVRQLAADLGVNLNTVSRAYRVLEASGLVRTSRGRGTVVIAERESGKGPAGGIRKQIGNRIRDVLVDASLAGLEREKVSEIIARELDRTYPKE